MDLNCRNTKNHQQKQRRNCSATMTHTYASLEEVSAKRAQLEKRQEVMATHILDRTRRTLRSFHLKKSTFTEELAQRVTQRVCPCCDSGSDQSVCCTTAVTLFFSLRVWTGSLAPSRHENDVLGAHDCSCFLHCFSAGTFLATLQDSGLTCVESSSQHVGTSVSTHLFILFFSSPSRMVLHRDHLCARALDGSSWPARAALVAEAQAPPLLSSACTRRRTVVITCVLELTFFL